MPDRQPTTGPIPFWAWIFAVICIAIPVVSVGGATPGAIGGGGAFACVAIARQTENSTSQHKITAQELDAVIHEGDAQGWPRG